MVLCSCLITFIIALSNRTTYGFLDVLSACRLTQTDLMCGSIFTMRKSLDNRGHKNVTLGGIFSSEAASMSRLTLALFEDMGYYVANYDEAACYFLVPAIHL